MFLGLFFVALGILDGQSLHEIEMKLRTDLYGTVVYNATLWIPAQLINFSLVPAPLQVLFANGIGFFWNIYLSYVGNKPVEDSDKENSIEV